jgi:hypothetical protein
VPVDNRERIDRRQFGFLLGEKRIEFLCRCPAQLAVGRSLVADLFHDIGQHQVRRSKSMFDQFGQGEALAQQIFLRIAQRALVHLRQHERVCRGDGDDDGDRAHDQPSQTMRREFSFGGKRHHLGRHRRL